MKNTNKKYYINHLLKIAGARPVSFNPEIARLLGGINEGLLFQQLFYWSDKGKRSDGWFYKTKRRIEEETCLTRYQQDTSREKLVKLGVIKTQIKKADGAPTIHYKIDLECLGKVENLLMEKQETSDSLEKQETSDSLTESTIIVQAGDAQGIAPLPDKSGYQNIQVIPTDEDGNPTNTAKGGGGGGVVDQTTKRLVKALKEEMELDKLDGGAYQWKSAKNISDRFGKILKDEGQVVTPQTIEKAFRKLVSTVASEDSFHRNNMTSMGYVDRNFEKLLKQFRHGK